MEKKPTHTKNHGHYKYKVMKMFGMWSPAQVTGGPTSMLTCMGEWAGVVTYIQSVSTSHLANPVIPGRTIARNETWPPPDHWTHLAHSGLPLPGSSSSSFLNLNKLSLFFQFLLLKFSFAIFRVCCRSQTRSAGSTQTTKDWRHWVTEFSIMSDDMIDPKGKQWSMTLGGGGVQSLSPSLKFFSQFVKNLGHISH